MPKDAIYARRNGAIATIYLNRPAKKNSLTVDMWRRLIGAIEDADRDTAVKVIVITGEGDTFSAGADIEEVEQAFANPKFGDTFADVTHDAQARLARNVKPTIAKVRGACMGGGCGIALCCDLRFADTGARFAITPAKLGIAYSLADTKRLMDMVGPARAKDILYTARILDASEAHALGMIDRLVPAPDLDAVVDAYAGQIASMSQYSTRATKRVAQMILDGATDDDRDSRRLFIDALSGADFKEGVSAFLQKRKPNFPVA